MRLALALLLAACDATTQDSACDVSSFNDFATRYAAALCGYDSPRVTDELASALGYWPADCGAELRDAEEQRRFIHLAGAISHGVVTFHADEASQCLCALGAGGYHLALPHACSRVFEGGPPGAPCATAVDCVEGAQCNIDSAGAPCGVCTEQVGGYEGRACTRFDDCSGTAYPLYCRIDDATGLGACAPSGDLGEPCAGFSCAPGATCGSDGHCIETTPPAAVGDLCDRMPSCGRDLVCVAVAGAHRCQTRLTDGTCRRSQTPVNDCVPGLDCSALSDDVLGTCGPRIGGGCLDFCPHGLHCVASMCEPRLGLGEPCSDDRSCVSGLCAAGVCATVPVCHPST